MFKKSRKRKYPKYLILFCFAIFLFVGVGYSVIYSSLGIEGTVVNSRNTWDVKFTDINYDSDSVSKNGASVSGNTQLNINSTLNLPGDVYGLSVDLVNNGSLPAVIKTLSISKPSSEQAKVLKYTVTYDDGSEMEVGDVLKSTETKKIKVRLEYKKLRDESIYPDSDLNISLQIKINFELPDEEFFNVKLISNGNTKNYKVSNLVQDLVLNDVEVLDSNKAIACSDGVVPITDETDKIVLKKIKKNATCRIENSLKAGIENGSNNEYVTLLNDDNVTTISEIVIPVDKKITLDLNGKTHISKSNVNSGYIVNNGKLKIIDSKEGGTLQVDYFLIDSRESAELTINGGTYIRSRPEATRGENGGVIIGRSEVFIYNAHIKADATFAIYTGVSNGKNIINIYNSLIENGPLQHGSIVSAGSQSVVNVYNSTIKSTRENALGVENGEIYLCKTNVSSTDNYDFSLDHGHIYYCSDSVFSNKTNVPLIKSGDNTLINQTDLACGE